MAIDILNLDIRKVIEEHREVTVIIVMILISIVAAKTFYGQQERQYENLKAKIANEQKKNEALERIVILNEKLKKNRRRGWDTIDFNVIVEKIFDMGLKSDVKIKDISPGDKKDESNYVAIPFSISGEAAYKNLFLFVRQLENYPKLFVINDLVVNPLTSPDGREERVSLSMVLSGEAIYFK